MTLKTLLCRETPLVALWLVAMVAGFGWIAKYDMTPTPNTEFIDEWPATTELSKPISAFGVVMFVHPHCPCTRASLRELEKLLRHTPSQIQANVVFVLPPGHLPGWEHGSLWNQARDMNARPSSDTDGIEATRFGATVSGEVFVFDRQDRLRFHGGITRSRGHEGANAGSNAISSLLSTNQPHCMEAPLYGCPLTMALHDKEAVKATEPCPCRTERS